LANFQPSGRDGGFKLKALKTFSHASFVFSGTKSESEIFSCQSHFGAFVNRARMTSSNPCTVSGLEEVGWF
jgi:hypothetical protein